MRWRTSTPLLIAFCTCCGVLIECFLAAAPTDAQIYRWRDDRGTLVLSDRPRSTEADAVSASAISRATVSGDAQLRRQGARINQSPCAANRRARQ
jgi:hypothetical protein